MAAPDSATPAPQPGAAKPRGGPGSPSLSDMLDGLEALAHSDAPVRVEQMLAATGRSTFGPLLLVPGLLVLSPVGGMPGIPTTVAVLVGMASLQILAGRRYIWLPRWLLDRCARPALMVRAIRFMRPLARASEAVFRSRMRWMTGEAGTRVIAALCLAICIAMPPLELVPLANSTCGGALALFGLALTTRDGVLAAAALVLSLAAAVGIAMAVAG
ncbi:exopolysaccharide biosynthesis protein [Orrella sp. JC864]|uniref:exopolysaccharide biosynthesis protein n=1 Tax=Orrella sp. JC864 TaxID=3120298 RepID=UPI0012BBACF3